MNAETLADLIYRKAKTECEEKGISSINIKPDWLGVLYQEPIIFDAIMTLKNRGYNITITKDADLLAVIKP